MVLRMMYYELNNNILTILTKNDETYSDIEYLDKFIARHESQINSIEIVGKIGQSLLLIDYIKSLDIKWSVSEC